MIFSEKNQIKYLHEVKCAAGLQILWEAICIRTFILIESRLARETITKALYQESNS